jgi:hypothetical protein
MDGPNRLPLFDRQPIRAVTEGIRREKAVVAHPRALRRDEDVVRATPVGVDGVPKRQCSTTLDSGRSQRDEDEQNDRNDAASIAKEATEGTRNG